MDATPRRYVLVVAASLFGISVGSTTKEASARYQLEQLQEALLFFQMEQGRLPTVEEGLSVLTEPVYRGKPIILAVPTDPWGRQYWYDPTAKDSTIGTVGPDAVRGTADDIATGLSESPVRRHRGLGCDR